MNIVFRIPYLIVTSLLPKQNYSLLLLSIDNKLCMVADYKAKETKCEAKGRPSEGCLRLDGYPMHQLCEYEGI